MKKGIHIIISFVLFIGLFAFVQDGLFGGSYKVYAAEDAGNKEDTGTKNEDKAKLIKNLNAIYIEIYKAKFDQTIESLKENIKDRSKEEQIKILSSVLIPLNSKIKYIEGNVNISQNRKEVLVLVLKYLKTNIEIEIKNLLDNN